MKNNIGTTIKGFCNGFFGRDDYEDKLIIYETEKSICCMWIGEYSSCKGLLTVANFESLEEKNKYIQKWKEDENER